ncbi:MAG: hypothetical protein KGL44_09065 [Sphingomonadales bacterium]|nr:hypothetical protein [Sphingomonadales bacterium]
MANNVEVRISAEISDLTAKLARARADFQVTSKALRDLSKESQGAALTDDLKMKFLAAGEAAAKSTHTVDLFKREIQAARAAQVAETAAVGANTAAHMSNRAARQGLVIIHEALSGNYHRMAGSLMIEAQALAGGSAAMLGMAVAATAVVGALGYLALKEYEAETHAASMAEAFAITGRGALNTAEAIRAQVDSLAELPGVSRDAAEHLKAFDAEHADVSDHIAFMTNQLIPAWAKAWGEEAPQQLNRLKSSLAEIESGTLEQSIRKFEELNRTLLNLPIAESQAIEKMIQLGDTTGATDRIISDLASHAGVHLESITDRVAKTKQALEGAKLELAAVNQAMAMPASPELMWTTPMS